MHWIRTLMNSYPDHAGIPGAENTAAYRATSSREEIKTKVGGRTVAPALNPFLDDV